MAKKKSKKLPDNQARLQTKPMTIYLDANRVVVRAEFKPSRLEKRQAKHPEIVSTIEIPEYDPSSKLSQIQMSCYHTDGHHVLREGEAGTSLEHYDLVHNMDHLIAQVVHQKGEGTTPQTFRHQGIEFGLDTEDLVKYAILREASSQVSYPCELGGKDNTYLVIQNQEDLTAFLDESLNASLKKVCTKDRFAQHLRGASTIEELSTKMREE